MANIEFQNIQKRFGAVRIIDGLNLSIQSGEFIVLLGESGCGKTTLLRMLAGLESVSGGSIAVAGRVVNDLEPKDRGCAMVFQNYALFPHMDVRGNLHYGMKLAKVPVEERNGRVARAAEMLSITHLLDRRPSQLSGGQRQRVAIGRAIVRQPSVFLFDEPLSNLDAKLRTEMRIELRQLHDRLGTTSIFVTHDQAEAMTLADRIVIMNKGKIEQIGTPDEIYHRPETLFVAGFIGSPVANLIELDISRAAGRATATLLTKPINLDGVEAGTQKLVAALKPEHIAIAETGVAAVIQARENLGSTILLHCDCAGLPVVVSLSAEVAPPMGQRDVHLDFALERVGLYDPLTGKRLARATLQAAG